MAANRRGAGPSAGNLSFGSLCSSIAHSVYENQKNATCFFERSELETWDALAVQPG